MRNILASLALGSVAALSLTSCSAGPHQLARSVDDWDQKFYVENPVVDGVLHFIPVIPIVSVIASFGDFFITDAYAFWLHDAWDGKGTAFEHHAVKPTDGSMSSLLNEGSGWLKVKK